MADAPRRERQTSTASCRVEGQRPKVMVSVEAELTFASLEMYHSARTGQRHSPLMDPLMIARGGGPDKRAELSSVIGQPRWMEQSVGIEFAGDDLSAHYLN